MDARVVTALLLATVLAGCSADPSVEAPADPAVPQSVTTSTCAIRGVVTDEAIVPLAGANITVVGQGLRATTGSDGGFEFCGLPDGTYFLEVSKRNHEKVQVSVTVGAMDKPPILKVVLPRLPGTDPYLVPMQWDGFMACSWFIAVAFATGCLIGEYIDDDSRQFDQPDARPHFMQSELSWEHTQPAGENLCMRHYASSGIGGDILGDICGPNPLVFQVDADKIEETGVGNTRGIERVVWVDFWLAPNTAGVAIDQPFTVFTHLFFNFQPVDGWTFLEQGEHPVPS